MAKRAPTEAEKRHMGMVARQGCLVCGASATIHHVTASIHGGRISRSHWLVVPLCPTHHQIQWGPRESVEALGHDGFFKTHNIDLLATAARLMTENERRAA